MTTGAIGGCSLDGHLCLCKFGLVLGLTVRQCVSSFFFPSLGAIHPDIPLSKYGVTNTHLIRRMEYGVINTHLLRTYRATAADCHYQPLGSCLLSTPEQKVAAEPSSSVCASDDLSGANGPPEGPLLVAGSVTGTTSIFFRYSGPCMNAAARETR